MTPIFAEHIAPATWRVSRRLHFSPWCMASRRLESGSDSQRNHRRRHLGRAGHRRPAFTEARSELDRATLPLRDVGDRAARFSLDEDALWFGRPAWNRDVTPQRTVVGGCRYRRFVLCCFAAPRRWTWNTVASFRYGAGGRENLAYLKDPLCPLRFLVRSRGVSVSRHRRGLVSGVASGIESDRFSRTNRAAYRGAFSLRRIRCGDTRTRARA